MKHRYPDIFRPATKEQLARRSRVKGGVYGYGLPVIATILPSLVLNKISMVQAMDRNLSSVFYLDVETNYKSIAPADDNLRKLKDIWASGTR